MLFFSGVKKIPFVNDTEDSNCVNSISSKENITNWFEMAVNNYNHSMNSHNIESNKDEVNHNELYHEYVTL